MKIAAKITFKMGRIVEVLKLNNISIKEFSKMCGWKYQNAMDHISMKRIVRCENHENFFNAINRLDASISFEECFPPDYESAVKAFHPRESIQDIDLGTALEYKEDMINLDCDPIYLEIDNSLDFKKCMDFVLGPWSPLTKVEKDIIMAKSGINEDHPLSFNEVADKLRIKASIVHLRYNRAMRKCFQALSSRRLRPFDCGRHSSPKSLEGIMPSQINALKPKIIQSFNENDIAEFIEYCNDVTIKEDQNEG